MSNVLFLLVNLDDDSMDFSDFDEPDENYEQDILGDGEGLLRILFFCHSPANHIVADLNKSSAHLDLIELNFLHAIT